MDRGERPTGLSAAHFWGDRDPAEPRGGAFLDPLGFAGSPEFGVGHPPLLGLSWARAASTETAGEDGRRWRCQDARGASGWQRRIPAGSRGLAAPAVPGVPTASLSPACPQAPCPLPAGARGVCPGTRPCHPRLPRGSGGWSPAEPRQAAKPSNTARIETPCHGELA